MLAGVSRLIQVQLLLPMGKTGTHSRSSSKRFPHHVSLLCEYVELVLPHFILAKRFLMKDVRITV